MMTTEMTADLRERFQELLSTVITQGRIPDNRADVLGPHTWAAIALVADEHPEATAELIANAYDTFWREHG